MTYNLNRQPFNIGRPTTMTMYDNLNRYTMQVIYQPDPEGPRILYATDAPNERAALVECVTTGRLGIIDIRNYDPRNGPMFDVYDDEWRANRGHPNVDPARSTLAATAAMASASAPKFTAVPITAVPITAVPIMSQSNPSVTYWITERTDTVCGGTYLHCTCPSWKFKKGKGEDCKHILEVKNHRGIG